MLFYTDKEGKILLHPEVVKLVPEFRELDEQQIRYMVLSTDYFALFHQYPKVERKRKAKGWVYGRGAMDPELDDHLKECIEIYDSLQFNEKQHMLDILVTKKYKYELLYQHEEDPGKSSILLKAIQDTQAAIDRYRLEVITNMQSQAVLKGGKTKSLLEIMQSNRQLSDLRKKAASERADRDISNEMQTAKEHIAK